MSCHATRRRFGRLAAAVAAVSIVASCSQGSATEATTTTTEPATTTTAVDATFQRLSASILGYYTTSATRHIKSIMTEAKADCMATRYLKFPGAEAVVDQSPEPLDFSQLQLTPPSGSTTEDMGRPFWQCLTVNEIVDEVYGDNGDCCRDIYPESILACVRKDLAKMDKEEVISELFNYFMGRPLGDDYKTLIVACGISVAE